MKLASYRHADQERFGAVVDDTVVDLTDQGDAISWLTARLSGEPAGSTCSTLPSQS